MSHTTPSSAGVAHHLVVRKVDGGWALFVDDVPMPAWTVTRRQHALRAAREVAHHHDARLWIHHPDGRREVATA